jgi:pimeloyl-ACP methyl ester carboxylesterase
VDDQVYFLSDMSGVISLYRMEGEGSMPEPLLPSGLALQNPHLMLGESYVVFPKLRKILVMIDNNGDENYQPSFIPLEGGIPEPLFGEKYEKQQVACVHYDRDANMAYFCRDDRKTPNIECLRVNLRTLEQTSLGTSIYGNYCAGTTKDHSKVILMDGYTAADEVLYLWNESSEERELLFGVPLERREADKEYPPSGISTCNFTEDSKKILFTTTLLNDKGSLASLELNDPSKLEAIPISGIRHRGVGELEDIRRVDDNLFLLQYNINGCTWVYEGKFHDGEKPRFIVQDGIVGPHPTRGGVTLGIEREIPKGRRNRGGYVFSFTTATNPSQLYYFNPTAKGGKRYSALSNERVVGIDEKYLARGKEMNYASFDGLRINARLYLPSKALGAKEPYPLVLYVHGGPQGQERPDFTWFSMPLIQYLTLSGLAVFVPNVRGSTGYGLKFMKWVDHDWGGKDARDHIEGLKLLEDDDRIDSSKRGVVGRSYGGYMTLMLVSRYPEMWKAGVDMFGPYNLLTFLERLPETWRTQFYLSIGHPEKDRKFLIERSPVTHIDNVKCPMLVIQGRRDPRVVEQESTDLVGRLRARGIPADFLVFEDEGHDVIKLKNRVTCYSRITKFFTEQLKHT